jgi:hypothetical protein
MTEYQKTKKKPKEFVVEEFVVGETVQILNQDWSSYPHQLIGVIIKKSETGSGYQVQIPRWGLYTIKTSLLRKV